MRKSNHLDLDGGIAVRLDPARRVPQGPRRNSSVDVLKDSILVDSEVGIGSM